MREEDQCRCFAKTCRFSGSDSAALESIFAVVVVGGDDFFGGH